MHWKEQAKARFQPWLGPALSWYQQREVREQRALQVMASALVLAACWMLVWQPLYQGRLEARRQYVRAAQTLSWIRSNAPAVRQARTASGAGETATGTGWITRISSSASSHGLALKGFTPQGESVRVLLENQPFARVIAWLHSLRREHGVRVVTISISRGARPGGVNVRATLIRGS